MDSASAIMAFLHKHEGLRHVLYVQIFIILDAKIPKKVHFDFVVDKAGCFRGIFLGGVGRDVCLPSQLNRHTISIIS